MNAAPAGRAYSDVDEQLIRLAAVLDEPLRMRLLALAQADSRAGEVIDLEQRTQRAEDLAHECRRQLQSMVRRNDLVTRLLEISDVTVERLRLELGVRPRPRPEFAASRATHVVEA